MISTEIDGDLYEVVTTVSAESRLERVENIEVAVEGEALNVTFGAVEGAAMYLVRLTLDDDPEIENRTTRNSTSFMFDGELAEAESFWVSVIALNYDLDLPSPAGKDFASSYDGAPGYF